MPIYIIYMFNIYNMIYIICTSFQCKLMNQIKDETAKTRKAEQRRNREVSQLKKEQRNKDNQIRSLETEKRKKEIVLKRKLEEVCRL